MVAVPKARLMVGAIFGVLYVTTLIPVGASSANISHSYSTTSTVKSGSLVSVNPKEPQYVDAANTGNNWKLLGVAVTSTDSLLALDTTPGKLQVATTGVANALVSTLYGDIKVGDEIGVSPFSGVGAKARPGSQVVGLAQTKLSGNTSGSEQQTVTDTKGNRKAITVGYVTVDIGITSAPKANAEANVNELQKVVASITGRVVSTVRIVLSLVIASLAIIALLGIIYVSINTGITSIGRNPLAKHAIFKSLAAIAGLSTIMLLISSITIFLLLR